MPHTAKPMTAEAATIAREAGVATVFNPAPSEPVDDAIWPLCDYVTPNENEAALLTGKAVGSIDDARAAGDAFLANNPPEVVWHGFQADGYVLAAGCASTATDSTSVPGAQAAIRAARLPDSLADRLGYGQ